MRKNINMNRKTNQANRIKGKAVRKDKQGNKPICGTEAGVLIPEDDI